MTTMSRRDRGGWIQLPIPFPGVGEGGVGAEAVRVRTAERAVEEAHFVGCYTIKKYPIGADIDEYRAHWGHEEGSSRFYHEHKPVEVLHGLKNLMLTDGVNTLFKYMTGLGVAPATSGTVTQAKLNLITRYSACVGVGDGGGSVPTPSASDVDLHATSNVYYVNSDSVPVVSTNTITITGTFGATRGNFSWRELLVSNASASVIGGSYPQFMQGVGESVTSKLGTNPTISSYSAFSLLGSDMGSKSSGSSWSVSWQLSIS